MNRRRLGIALALTALGGCSMAPHYARPELPVPQGWPTGDAYLRQSEAALPSYSWREVFSDPRLQGVIAQALAGNQDVKAAAAQIAAARAQYGIQKAELLPELTTSTGYRRAGDGNGNAGDAFSAQGSVTGYELDLFGRLASLSEASKDSWLATTEGARSVRLTLVSDTASAWLTYASDSSLLALARRTADAARQSVRLTRLRLEGGIAPRSDLRQAEIVLYNAEADVAAQTNAVARDLNALQLLAGGPIDPGLLPPSIDEAGAQLADIPAGLDSGILLRRPDVIAAEWQLRGANAQIGAARAALFPRISLTSVLGFASSALGALFDNGSFAWSAGAGASYPIFSGGAGKAGVALSEARRDAALAAYRKAVQSAFADVANVLARRGTIEPQLAAARAARDSAADNQKLAEMRYRGGVNSWLQELTARQALYSAEKALVAVQLQRATNRVALYRSLGGDALLDSGAIVSETK